MPAMRGDLNNARGLYGETTSVDLSGLAWWGAGATRPRRHIFSSAAAAFISRR